LSCRSGGIYFNSFAKGESKSETYLLETAVATVAETVFVIPAEAGIQFFALDPCFRRGDIVDFRFPQQIFSTCIATLNVL